MRVLDLFAGLCGWSEPFAERGHDVFSIDLDTRFDVSLHADILEVRAADLPWKPDIILASPPCEAFSVMTIGRNWTMDHQPKTDKARLAVRLVEATRRIIDETQPAYFVIENPRGKLRKLAPLADLDRRTVTYCQYGMPYMKPTDLWGGFPPSLTLLPTCRPQAPCHQSATRVARTGGMGETRWVHPVLAAQSNNGHREDERTRAQAGRAFMRASRDGLTPEASAWLDGLPPRKSKTFRGGMIEEMARFPSWSAERASLSAERASLSAERAKIPAALALAVCEAADRDLAAGAKPMPMMLWAAS